MRKQSPSNNGANWNTTEFARAKQLFRRLFCPLAASLWLAISSGAILGQASGQECGADIFVNKNPSQIVEPTITFQEFLLPTKSGISAKVLLRPPALLMEEQNNIYVKKTSLADFLTFLRQREKLGYVQEITTEGVLDSGEATLVEECNQLECLEVDSAKGLRLKQFAKLKKLKVHKSDSLTVKTAAELKSLEEVLFRNMKSDENVIARLSALPALKNLDLQFIKNSHVSAETIGRFSSCKQLTDFGMMGVPITDEIAHSISKIKTLRTLYLDKPADRKKFDRLCKILGSLPDLYFFNYMNDKDVETARYFPYLRSYGVNDMQLSENSIDILSGLKHLRFLYIRNSELPDNGLDKLCSLPQIEEITLENSKLSIKRSLTPREHNFSLNLTGSDVDDVSLQYLVKLGHFQFLNLSRTKITNDGLFCLKDLPVSNIDVSNTNVYESGIEALLRNPSIRYIGAYYTKFNPLLREGMKVIEKAKQQNVAFNYKFG